MKRHLKLEICNFHLTVPMFIEGLNDMKKQNMAVGFADLTNFARLVDAVDSEKAIEFLQDAFKVAVTPSLSMAVKSESI
jgi:hypothetical protein